jgi:hypothetical protein
MPGPKGTIARGALEHLADIIDLSKFKSQQLAKAPLSGQERELYSNFKSDIFERARALQEKSLAHSWQHEIGDRVITGDEIARAANPTPWEITGRIIKKKGLLEESRPREGIMIYGEDVPYYNVRRGIKGESEEITMMPEWAFKTNFGIKGSVD